MPIYFLDNCTVLFIHIPKTGGTTIEQSLRIQKEPAFYDEEFASPPAGAMCSPQHYHAEILKRLFPDNIHSHSFTVVRDPLARIVSEFRYQKELWRRMSRKVMINSRKAYPIRASSFSEWLSSAIKIAQKNLFVFDNHLRPQFEFLIPDIKVFKLEDGLTPVYDYLEEILCFRPQGEEIFSKKSNSEKILIRKNDVKLIFEFYSEDYNILSYEKIISHELINSNSVKFV